MNKPQLNPDEAKLGALLRESRATPSLPPRFQENVWRRIDTAAAPQVSMTDLGWLTALANWILRPRRALALVVALALAGVGLGWSQGERLARDDAQARYIAAVAPNSLR